MKKVFWTYSVGAILLAMLAAGQPVKAEPAWAGEKDQKQKVKIVVIDKKEKPGGGSRPQKPQPENGARRP